MVRKKKCHTKSNTDLHGCLAIEFEENCIQTFVKCSASYQDELRAKLRGILKLKKNPQFKMIDQNKILNGLVIF